MIPVKPLYDNMFNSVARRFVGRVELLNGDTLVHIFSHDDALKSFTIEKTGSNDKFFGYGICQKLIVNLNDPSRTINIQKGQQLQIAEGVGKDYTYAHPLFYVDDVVRDEKTNALTITAYDAIYTANSKKVKDLDLPMELNIKMYAAACAEILGAPIAFINIPAKLFDISFLRPDVNLKEDASVREALDDVAELLGAIYYISEDWELTFRRLDIDGEPVAIIDKSKYFDLSVKTANTLADIASVNDLGDNVISTSGYEGEIQYLRDNAFLSFRNDVGVILNNLLSNLAGLTLLQFTCKHRGDFRLELGDKVSLITKDNDIVDVYILSDTITYNGGLSGETNWSYQNNETETEANPSTIGDTLKQASAKVDKLANEINLLVSETNDLTEQIARLDITSESITATVEENSKDIDALNSKVEASITADAVTIMIQDEMANGVSSVTTETGYSFGADGLNISKSGTDTNTTITENGLTVYSSFAPTLVADSQGVTATNLYASTFVTISGVARFEQYDGGTRIGCFWIGG